MLISHAIAPLSRKRERRANRRTF
ncbi:hypothetical protein CBM2625_B170113 [Cupriavidus taiwanensis]|uniref:Uncharacterized protein n=1 Tax=Cupriavidus taiwanensis TaxID=164546 RepID=A0A976B1U7_9BURK|nr:hypothetical protein CBM2614_B200114 [Cupriavidus taiwanensis]SOZ70639.1 hypothetical protein CBM2613_B170078 [Cupriavidus taiwanensis]SPA08791.1 hypothetical protein CBM2625_B170113 [Cupriavidus taiwanensis]